MKKIKKIASIALAFLAVSLLLIDPASIDVAWVQILAGLTLLTVVGWNWQELKAIEETSYGC